MGEGGGGTTMRKMRLNCLVLLLTIVWSVTLQLIARVDGIYVVEKAGRKSYVKLSPAQWTEPDDGGLWSSLLEEYTLGFNSSYRSPRVMQATAAVVSQTHQYIPASSFYINKRVGEAVELSSPTAKVIGPSGYAENQLNPPSGQNTFTPMRQTFGGASPTELLASPREVSETDLYLLGAIEKLVYRVDYMEGRLRRAEQIIYYLMAGNNQKIETCPDNFTRVHDICYHFGIERGLNWKSASTLCKSYGGHLAEFETSTEFQDVVAYILNNQANRGKEYWLGGLNPGLLWIWTQSAKPVNPNTNLTSITAGSKMSTSSSSTTTTTSKPDSKREGIKIVNNKPQKQMEPILEITGSGRCLKLSYNGALYTYHYTGQDCSSRYNYICELKNKSLDNEISRIAKQLELD
ncbi:uncharacterized protein LOC129775599 [Toxorhynchites rutilus septentrionalis]|uniref:uncharacterized protein LOC129775599 n=1 Tax=Toxorhynchites rutilus septentrionalis TaxID=329112 RepID=UPI00247A4CAB|nr:uncharacterized protein LOC129775599 [Toxorhynchites rutilus septentrionalis]